MASRVAPQVPPPEPTAGDAGLREVELKLAVPPASVGRIASHPFVAAHAIGPWKASRLVARYYDTPKRELAAHGLALRLRRAGSRWTQTLKSGEDHGAPLSSRGEWETPLASARFSWPALRSTPLADLGSPQALARRLRPVFTTDFRRETRLLRLADGCVVELAFDRGTISTGSGRTRRTAPICEIEIEIKERGGADAEDEVLRFAARLARDLPLLPLAASKASRGDGLLNGEADEPAKVALPEPRADGPARVHLGRVVDSCVAALLANAHMMLAPTTPGGATDVVEAVHQARVAIRRLRSALRVFRPVASARRYGAIDDRLREVGRVFGEVRDWDVLATETTERLAKVVGDDGDAIAALAEVEAAITSRRTDALAALTAFVEEGVFGATTIATARLARRAAREDGSPTLARCAPRWLESQRSRIVERVRRIAVLDTAARHRLRIEVKRLRYALDLFEPLYAGEAVERFHDALADLQEKLGHLNDAKVASDLLRTLPPSPARDLVLARYDAWFDAHVEHRLPKIGAASVVFERAPRPWADAETTPAG